MSYSVITNYKTTLSSPMTSTQLTVPVNSIVTRDNTPHTIVTADMGDGWYLTTAPGTADEEIIEVTAVTPSGSGGIFTVPTLGRGLAYYGPTDAQGAGNAKAHNPGDIVILSNVKNVYDRMVDKESDETIDGIKTFLDSPIVPTPSGATQAANKSYVDGVAIAGAPDASTTVKGISKLSTAPVSPTDPIVVGDNDTRVPTQGENDALVGDDSSIAVGTGNKFVTQTGLQKSTEKYAVATGTDTYAVTLSPAPILASIAAGFTMRVKFTNACTTASTINPNGLGAVAIKRAGSIATGPGDIPAGGVLELCHDGTNFVIDSMSTMSQASATTLTASPNSAADALHTHYGGYQDYTDVAISSNAYIASSQRAAFSDATTKILSYGFTTDTTDLVYYKGLSLAADFGSALYTTTVPTSTSTPNAVEICGLIIIGSDIWTTDGGAAGARTRKNGTSVTVSGTAPSTTASTCLGHDPTNSYLLMLDSTTTIKRYSGIAGTTITFVSTITLDTAVTMTGWVYDNTNARYICLDTTGNVVRRFNSSGTTIDTAAYTITDTNVCGLAIFKGRVYLVVAIVDSSGSRGRVQVQYVPTTMTI